MSSISIRLLLGAALACAGCAKRYRTEGVVLRVDRTAANLVISHRAIPGYMPAMAMPFTVSKPADLDGVSPGSRIEFTLRPGRGRASVSRVKLLRTRIDDVALPALPRKLAVGQPVSDFTLIGEAGQPVRLSSFQGRLVAMDFIYTRCPIPEVCPRLSANFALLQKRFGNRIVLLSITLDPAFDTPAVLADYARRWRAGPDWRFLTGPIPDIAAISGRFGLVYWPEDGLITHSSVTALVGPNGALLALLEGASFTSSQLLDLVTECLAPKTL